jgi:ribosome biogenesis GTPase
LSPDHRISLGALGWTSWFDERFLPHRAQGLEPGRVTADHGAIKTVHTGEAELLAETAGRLAQVAPGADATLPAVGDWVAIRLRPGLARIDAVLERRSAIRRRAASAGGRGSLEQVLAANVDLALLVTAVDAPRAERRIERYLTAVFESGASALVVLTKADIGADSSRLRAELESVAGGTPVVMASALHGDGMEQVAAHIRPGQTAVLLGPSGAGKSTLLNRLMGADTMATRQVRSDGKGRHTTTHRQLFRLPGGGMVVDTPGLRELQLWTAEDEPGSLFEDVEELAAGCRFNDCSHTREPGCAVLRAIGEGALDAGRLRSYRKLQREQASVPAHVARRRNKAVWRHWKRTLATMQEEDSG